MSIHAPVVLRGRAPEREALKGLLDTIRSGRSASLVIRGEPGMGKTALLQELLGDAPDCSVERIAGVETELELPFAALHQICAPRLDRLGVLPAPQRAALEVALGASSGAPPDRFLIGLATLSLVAETAAGRPLLCVVDDAQWLDRASAQTLGFVARRLQAESVGLVFAVRSGHDRPDLAGLPVLELEGLPDRDARELLETVIPGRIDARVLDRLVAETRGNPLALLELPRGLSASELAGGFGVPSSGALSGTIEETFLRRVDELPDDARVLLLVAAAEPLGDPMVMWRAAGRLGVGPPALEPATRLGMLDVGTRVRFQHPLLRSAVYRSASPLERQTVHGMLAEAIDADLEPDQRAWHRAAATRGRDDDVANELERSAGRARARGGMSAAAAFLARAADLTVDPAHRAQRMLAAAESSLQAGAFDSAIARLGSAQAGPLDELGRARADMLEAAVAYAQNRDGDAPPLLARAARTLEALDIRLARATYLEAWGAALFAGRFAANVGVQEVSEAVRRAPEPPDAPTASDLLLDGFARVYTEGRVKAVPVLERATAAFADGKASGEEVLRWSWLAAAGAVYVWDFDTCVSVAGRGAELARGAGALEALGVSVNVLAQGVALSGDFVRAATLVAEADAVREATGTRVGPYGALVLAALRGREEEAGGLISATIAEATNGGQGTAVQYAHWARAVLANSLGHHEEAVEAATAAVEAMPELFVAMWSLSELIEGARAVGHAETAASALASLEKHTAGTGADWARAMQARGTALLTDGPSAEPLYREAIDRLARTRLRPEHARAQLLFGEWLRRSGREPEAPEHLRAAYDAFAAMGAEAFAERARLELAAVGEDVDAQPADSMVKLTPQEERIARLAAHGLKNAEIGSQLLLSPRTVEWHLKKVFSKLGISSRRELDDALFGGSPPV